MEIITGVERRRHWRTGDKLRIVAEAEQPGACFAAVARRHEVSRSVLWAWRKQVREGALVAEPAPVFLPVQVTPEPSPVAVPDPRDPAAGGSPACAGMDPASDRGCRGSHWLPRLRGDRSIV